MGCLSFCIYTAMIIVIIYLMFLALQFICLMLPFIAIIWLVRCIIDYKEKQEYLPTKMECPNCGGGNTKIKSIQTGEITNINMSGTSNSVGYNFFGYRTYSSLNGRGRTKKDFTFKRECICEDCGYNFEYHDYEEVYNVKKNSKIKLIMSIIFLVISIIIAVSVYCQFPIDNDSKEPNKIWENEYTPIEEFDYYLDGNNVYLKDYEGNSKQIKINSSYNIDGKTYNIVSFVDAVFALDNIYSVILPEGLITMPSNTFNSCNIKYVYIPATLQPNNENYPFYKYFHDVEKIYYGGTEEQWKYLTNNEDRSKIDAKEIVYNANISELK